MNQWIRLRHQDDEPAAAAVRRLRVQRVRPGRPETIETFLEDPGLDDAFSIDSNTVISGDGEMVFIAVLFRRPDVDHAFFSEYWREEHVRFGHLIPHARSYIQLHADPAAPYDGVCEVAFDSLSDLKAGMSAPIVALDARRDEEVFIDHQRSYGLVCRAESVSAEPAVEATRR